MVDLNKRRWLRGRVAPALRPPWAQRPDERFTEACTRCGDCLPACPQRIIASGDGGFPKLDFSRAGCTFCGACADACRPRALDRRLEPPITAVARIAPNCLAQRQVECRVCGETCDAGALRFPPRRGGVPLPVLEADRCTGCGECVAGCPVQAISVPPPAA